jgi:hypothetical protein
MCACARMFGCKELILAIGVRREMDSFLKVESTDIFLIFMMMKKC